MSSEVKPQMSREDTLHHEKVSEQHDEKSKEFKVDQQPVSQHDQQQPPFQPQEQHPSHFGSGGGGGLVSQPHRDQQVPDTNPMSPDSQRRLVQQQQLGLQQQQQGIQQQQQAWQQVSPPQYMHPYTIGYPHTGQQVHPSTVVAGGTTIHGRRGVNEEMISPELTTQERLEEIAISTHEDVPAGSGISDISTVKKKSKPQESGVFSGFSLFKRKNADEKSILAQKEKLDRFAKDIKNSTDQFYLQVKQAQSEPIGEYVLPNYFDSIIEQLTDVFDNYSEKERVLKRHIKDIESRSPDRAKHWRFWANTIARDPQIAILVNYHNFVEVSAQSISELPMDLNEVIAFKELLNKTLIPGFNTDNVVNVLSIQKKILTRDQELAVREAIHRSKIGRFDYGHFDHDNLMKTEVHKNLLNMVSFWGAEKEDLGKKLSVSVGNITNFQMERQNGIQVLNRQISDDAETIKKNDTAIREHQLAIDTLKRENTRLEDTIQVNTKKLDDLKKDDRFDLTIRRDHDLLKSRHDLAAGVFDLLEKFYRGYTTALFNYKNLFYDYLERSISELEQIKYEWTENNRPLTEGKAMELHVDASKLKEMVTRLPLVDSDNSEKLDPLKKRICDFIESIESEKRAGLTQLKKNLKPFEAEQMKSTGSEWEREQKTTQQQTEQFQQQQQQWGSGNDQKELKQQSDVSTVEQQKFQQQAQQQPPQQQQQQGGDEQSKKEFETKLIAPIEAKEKQAEF